jgi:type IV fimbrial biogenesis protein FimT
MSRQICNHGVTIIELLVALSITAVLMASAIPSFQGALERLQLSTTTNDLLLAVNLARTEAASRRARVAVVPQSAHNWTSGWHVFIDANDNGQLDAGEIVLRTFDAVPARLTVDATFGAFDGHVLSFDHTALLRRPGSNGMVLGRMTVTANADVRTLCFSAASVRTVRAPTCT